MTLRQLSTLAAVALWSNGYILHSATTVATDIEIGVEIIQPVVKRFGINLGAQNYYDSGQMMKDILFGNGGFEGQIWNSTVRCSSGTPTSCVDDNPSPQWPSGFWNGASFEVFYGAAAGRKGTVVSSRARTQGLDATLYFASSGVVPAKGDYLIARKTFPGGATAGWWPETSEGGEITTEFQDLPPGSAGRQAIRLAAPRMASRAALSAFRDTVAGHSFLKLNGKFAVTFRAKGLERAAVTTRDTQPHIHVLVRRITNGGSPFLSEDVTLTRSWSRYALEFRSTEDGSIANPLEIRFSTGGGDSLLLDEVSVMQVDSDPANKTQFRDPVVAALQALQPGILRFWADQLGDTLDNLIAPPFARWRAGFSAGADRSDSISYGLHEFLELCETLRTEPWIVVPSTFSTGDASNLIDYLAATGGTRYGDLRGHRGHAVPWTQSFAKIHLEFGNEAWNGIFKGGSIEYPSAYGKRAQAIFAAMRLSPSFRPPLFDLVLGGQAAWPGRNADIQNNCNNNDSFTVAPYTMNAVDQYADNETLYGSTFAEPEALMVSSGRAEGVAPGMVYANYRAIQGSSRPVPLSFYEVNLSTLSGAIPQNLLETYVSSLGAGLMVADTMLLSLREFGVVNQALFALPQYQFKRSDGKTVPLWGTVVDMGVSDRKRPQYLALQLANQAMGTNRVMLRTVHSGADPTWNQPLVNTVKLNGAHYLQSFAFSRGETVSLIVFNLHRTSGLPVTFSGRNAPCGTVLEQQLTSANPTDNNETANLVSIQSRTLASFNARAGLSLPPYSMTVLTWRRNT